MQSDLFGIKYRERFLTKKPSSRLNLMSGARRNKKTNLWEHAPNNKLPPRRQSSFNGVPSRNKRGGSFPGDAPTSGRRSHLLISSSLHNYRDSISLHPLTLAR